VHLDFIVKDIKPVCEAIQETWGIVEDTAFSVDADIAHCVDPFGNGFCIIRE
jgi:predicted enzyme related to lactoylglutathione lyase